MKTDKDKLKILISCKKSKMILNKNKLNKTSPYKTNNSYNKKFHQYNLNKILYLFKYNSFNKILYQFNYNKIPYNSLNKARYNNNPKQLPNNKTLQIHKQSSNNKTLQIHKQSSSLSKYKNKCIKFLSFSKKKEMKLDMF